MLRIRSHAYAYAIHTNLYGYARHAHKYTNLYGYAARSAASMDINQDSIHRVDKNGDAKYGYVYKYANTSRLWNTYPHEDTNSAKR